MEKPAPPESRNPLTQHDWTDGVETERKRSMNLEISNAMVGLKKRYYGKGPENARTYLNDNYVMCVLEGGITRTSRRCSRPARRTWCATTGSRSRRR